MNLLKKIKNMLLINSITYFILGVIMLLFPGLVNNFICYLLGTIILVFGVSMIVNYFKDKNISNFGKITLIIGIMASIFGSYVLLNPTKASSFIPFIAGVILIVESIDKFKKAFELKEAKHNKWEVILTNAIIIFILSLILILYPFESVKLTIRIIGVFLLIGSVSDFWTINTYTKTSKKIIDEK